MDFNSIPSKINTDTAITPATQSAGSGVWQNPNLPLNRDRVYITAVLASGSFNAGEYGSLTNVGPVAFSSPISCTGVDGATAGTIAYYIQ